MKIDREMSKEGFMWSLAESGGACMCNSNNKGCYGNEVSID